MYKRFGKEVKRYLLGVGDAGTKVQVRNGWNEELGSIEVEKANENVLCV